MRKRFLLAPVCACLMLGAPALAQEESAAEPLPRRMDFAASFAPDGERFVYYSYRGDVGPFPDLYIQKIDGEERRLTTTPDIWEIEPAWSPNGDLIAFSAGTTMANLDLYVMDPKGGEPRLVHAGADSEGGAKWSPDGRKLVFFSFTRGVTHRPVIKIVDIDGGEVSTIVNQEIMGQPGGSGSPDWSPDGAHIAFTSREYENGEDRDTPSDLYVLTLGTGAIKRLTNTPWGEGRVVWSPDGKMLYFTAVVEGELERVHAIPADGSRPLDAKPIMITGAGLYDDPHHMPGVSPDGKHLSFTAPDPAGTMYAIYLKRLDGTMDWGRPVTRRPK